MSKAALVLTALFVDHQTPAEVAARYGVHRSWVYKLKARYEAEGDKALQPRSRRPHTSPGALDPAVAELITDLRDRLTSAGLDAGPETIAWHLAHHHRSYVSRATIARYLTRAGRVTPEPKKRPKSSYVRFQADLPNELTVPGLVTGAKPREGGLVPALRNYPNELRARAQRLVQEAREQDPELSLNAAVVRVGQRTGVNPDTLRGWCKQAEIDAGRRPGTTTGDAQRITELERENHELKRANEILLAASSFFARELDPRLPW